MRAKENKLHLALHRVARWEVFWINVR